MFKPLSFAAAVLAIVMFSGIARADVCLTNTDGVSSWNTEAGVPGLSQSLTFSSSEIILGVELEMIGLTHTWIGDFSIELIAPDATSLVVLGQQIGGGTFGDDSNLDGNYVFADGGASIWDASVAAGDNDVIAPGTYRASQDAGGGSEQVNFFGSTFVDGSRTANGTWTVNFLDSETAVDDGGLVGWKLTFITPVPEPSSLIVLGLAGIGMMSRRRRG